MDGNKNAPDRRRKRKKGGFGARGPRDTQRSFAGHPLASVEPENPDRDQYAIGGGTPRHRLAALVGTETCLLFPAYDFLAHEEAYEKEVAGQRLFVLSQLLTDKKRMVVTSWPALVRKVLPPQELTAFMIPVSIGADLGRDNFLQKLVTVGYNRVPKVEAPGEFSVRGDIVDLYPLDQTDPLRIEFFGDEVESIRTFDPETQKSVRKLESIMILPAREGLWTAEQFLTAREAITSFVRAQCERLNKQEANKKANEAAAFLAKRFAELLEKIEHGLVFPGMDRFLPLVHEELAPFWAYLPDALLVLHEPVRGSEYLRSLEEENARILGGFLERGLILPEETRLYLSLSEIQAGLTAQAKLHLSTLNRTLKGSKVDAVLSFPMRMAPDYAGQFKTGSGSAPAGGETLDRGVAGARGRTAA